jgi:PTS system nitrogen regulatory IIA component
MDVGKIDLEAMIIRGGVFVNIEGSNPKEILEDAVATIPLPPGTDRPKLLSAMLEREELMPTAVGRGIAIPHPRHPVLARNEDQLLSVCYPSQPIDYHALDRKPVFVLLILLSAQPRSHLQALSRISNLCQREEFLRLLESKPDARELAEYVRKAEESWHSTP